MDRMNIRVMVVEDEAEVRDTYRRLIKEHHMLQLVAEAENSDEAFQILSWMEVDALILDLEMPEGSGIFLLEQLQTLPIEKPFIAVVTNVVSKVIYDAIRNMGVDYICTKSVSDFSLETPLSIIEISAPYRKTRKSAEGISKTLNYRTKVDIYQRNIEFELSRMGFQVKKLGVTYIKEAILFLSLSDKPDISVTKEIYVHVASKYQTNVRNVEKNIRTAIEKVWTEQDIGKLTELYPFDWNHETGRPTNAEFLHNMTQKIFRQ